MPLSLGGNLAMSGIALHEVVKLKVEGAYERYMKKRRKLNDAEMLQPFHMHCTSVPHVVSIVCHMFPGWAKSFPVNELSVTNPIPAAPSSPRHLAPDSSCLIPSLWSLVSES